MPKLQIIEDGKKECQSCGEWLTLDQYFIRKNTGGYHPYCKECNRAKGRESYKNNKDNHYMRLYNITTKDVDRMKVEQDYKCATCGEEESGRGLFVDHCHETGKVRGLLCQNCNVALGMVKDDMNTLKNLIQYLENS